MRRLIAESGKVTQTLGFGRVVGQIYAYLYFTPGCLTLTDIQEALGISKGSVSMGVRRLERWKAVRRVWVKGDRKDYYEAQVAFGQIIRNAMTDAYSMKMETAATLLSDAMEQLPPDGDGSPFVRKRLERLETYRDRAQQAWENPIVQRLLG